QPPGQLSHYAVDRHARRRGNGGGGGGETVSQRRGPPARARPPVPERFLRAEPQLPRRGGAVRLCAAVELQYPARNPGGNGRGNRLRRIERDAPAGGRTADESAPRPVPRAGLEAPTAGSESVLRIDPVGNVVDAYRAARTAS